MTHRAAVRVALAQLSVRIGDIHGNAAQVIAAAEQARDESRAGVVVFPELALSGYPPDDLLLRKALPAAVAAALDELRQKIRGITAVVGYPEFADDGLYNAAIVLRDGRCLGHYRKQCLRDDGVFAECRYFRAGGDACVFEHAGWRLAVTLGIDICQPQPAAQAKAAGAELLLNAGASPFRMGAQGQRETVTARRSRD